MTALNAMIFQIGETLDSKEFGALRIIDIIGTGGMGTVYEAERLNSTRRYALKAMHPGLVTAEVEGRFRREADIMGRLNNTRIVKIHAFFRSQPQGVPCIVMDRLHGMTLSRLVRQGTKVNLPEVCIIASDLLGVLDYIHGLEIVHRDIKPDNVFLQKVGTNETLLTLIDFGIFKDLIESGKRADGSFIGTPRYAAFEQIGGGIVGPRTDLYAAGVVFYELLTGRHPYGLSVRQAVDPSAKPFPLLDLAPDTPVPIAEAIMAALDRDPSKRPESANDFARPFRRHMKAVARSSTNTTTGEGDLIANLTSAGASSASLEAPIPLAGPTGTVRVALPAGPAAATNLAQPSSRLATTLPPIAPTLPSAGNASPSETEPRHPAERSALPPEDRRASTSASAVKPSPPLEREPDDALEQLYAPLDERFRAAKSAGADVAAPPTLEGSSSSAWMRRRPSAAGVLAFLASALIATVLAFGAVALLRHPAPPKESAPLAESAATTAPMPSTPTTTTIAPTPAPPSAEVTAESPVATPPQPALALSAPSSRGKTAAPPLMRQAPPRATKKKLNLESVDDRDFLPANPDAPPPAPSAPAIAPSAMTVGVDGLNHSITH